MFVLHGVIMDWTRAIEINREALTRIVAGLVALLGIQGSVMTRLPRPIFQLVARILHPAEAAVRRLIVIAARGLTVSLPPTRLMPHGLVFAGNGTGPMVFQLFDSRKHFADVEDADPVSGPRIRTVGAADPRSVFLAKFAAHARLADANLASEAESTRIRRRLDAVRLALEHLPRQAKRMAQWQARRAMVATPKFTSPLRPGPPPGNRKRPKEEIDHILRECHGLAWDVLAADTS